jgi:hypothetical protein
VIRSDHRPRLERQDGRTRPDERHDSFDRHDDPRDDHRKHLAVNLLVRPEGKPREVVHHLDIRCLRREQIADRMHLYRRTHDTDLPRTTRKDCNNKCWECNIHSARRCYALLLTRRGEVLQHGLLRRRRGHHDFRHDNALVAALDCQGKTVGFADALDLRAFGHEQVRHSGRIYYCMVAQGRPQRAAASAASTFPQTSVACNSRLVERALQHARLSSAIVADRSSQKPNGGARGLRLHTSVQQRRHETIEALPISQFTSPCVVAPSRRLRHLAAVVVRGDSGRFIFNPSIGLAVRAPPVCSKGDDIRSQGGRHEIAVRARFEYLTLGAGLFKRTTSNPSRRNCRPVGAMPTTHFRAAISKALSE